MRKLVLPSPRGYPVTLGIVALVLAGSGSSASASTVQVVPVKGAASGSSAARTLPVGPAPHRAAYLRVTLRGVVGEMRRATLRVFKRSTAATALRVRLTSRWSSRAVRRGRGPALGSTIVRARTRRGRGWLALNVSPAFRGRKRIYLALVAPGRSRLRVAGHEARRGRTPRVRIETVALPPGAPPFAPFPPGSLPPEAATGEYVPYDVGSPWNTPVGAAATHPDSAVYISAIADNDEPLTSDPDRYTIPVYRFDDDTPRRTVQLTGHFSVYEGDDWSRTGYGTAPTIDDIPIPEHATPSAGTDGQVVFWNPRRGIEYGFWRFRRDALGKYTATNGYRYRTTAGHHGRFGDGLAGRGAGLPYLGGLVRKWEIVGGRIGHALAFAYYTPSADFVFPASKSDGGALDGSGGTELPAGTRLQLDPTLTETDFDARGLSRPAKIIARALQQYGMYVVDSSGSSKIYLEDRITAGWDAAITRDLISGIPWERFRAVVPPASLAPP